jgi:hypothetical protein
LGQNSKAILATAGRTIYGDLTPLGALQDPGEVKRYLKHMNIDYDPPPRGPRGEIQGNFGFEQQYDSEGVEPVFYPD